MTNRFCIGSKGRLGMLLKASPKSSSYVDLGRKLADSTNFNNAAADASSGGKGMQQKLSTQYIVLKCQQFSSQGCLGSLKSLERTIVLMLYPKALS